ncbi:hypothetical protein [Streptomyces sp. NPDC001537]
MLGCILEAVIDLHNAVAHPGQIGTLIAHEPVAPRLLPAAQCARHERELTHLQALYLREGVEMASPPSPGRWASTRPPRTPSPV